MKEKVITVLCAIVLIWGVASFIDVNMHNMTTHTYADWNLFSILF